MERSPESDLARIKWYRNQLSHNDSNTIDNAYFTKAWADLSYAVGRLGGQQMEQDCQELKSKALDPSNQELMREFRQSQKEMEEMKHTIDHLESGQEELKEKFVNLRSSYDSFKTRTNDSLQKLPPLHNDPANCIIETADPDVPSTSQALPPTRCLQSEAIETKHEEEDGIVKNNAEEGNKAAHRINENTNQLHEEKGHINHGYMIISEDNLISVNYIVKN
ncbi:uncharacterized protein LOC143066213 [Mytilus galloprovincialis]|uniref:uncharacterized protein LOC143066213 n=1 Tax=Mytilus galloprovincialis TaxID=29158 RepID=UPI003F7C2C53